MVYVPGTYQPITDITVLTMHREVIDLIEKQQWGRYCEVSSPHCQGLYTTTRNLTRNIGKCLYNNDGKQYAIMLSPHLLKMGPDRIRATLIHEIAHAYNPHDHHGHNWKWLADIVAHRFGLPDASRLETDPEVLAQCCKRKERKYEVKCPCCGATWRRAVECKLIKHPEKFRCGKCNEKLIRTK